MNTSPLTWNNVVKAYKDFDLELSLSIPRGYITGMVGANGAGKTTAMRCALGLNTIDSGTVDIVPNAELGVVFDSVHFPPDMTIKELFGHIRRFHKRWATPDLERWGLKESLKVKELSRGMGMKLQLAVALAHDPTLLVLDEPTSGIDPATRDDMLHALQDFVAGGENTVLLSTHITSDLEKCADYVAMLAEGQLVDFATLDDWITGYRMLKGAPGTVPTDIPLYGLRETEVGWTALCLRADAPSDVLAEPPTLEDIVVRLERGL